MALRLGLCAVARRQCLQVVDRAGPGDSDLRRVEDDQTGGFRGPAREQAVTVRAVKVSLAATRTVTVT